MPKKSQQQGNGWDVVSTAPASNAASGWDVVSSAPTDQSNGAVNDSGTPSSPKWLSSPSDVLDTLGQRAKNFVAAPYHAFADGPQNPQEQSVVDAGGGGRFGRLGLAADRLLSTSASQQSWNNAKTQWQSGDHNAAVQSAEDAVPFIGPWATQIETDTQNKGAVAGLTGLAFDALAPKALGKATGATMKGIGSVLRAASSTPEGLHLAATRTLVPGEPGAVLQRAIKPAVGYGPQAAGLLQDTLPDIVAENPNIQDLSDYAQSTQDAAGKRAQYHQNLISPYRRPSGPGPFRPSAIPGGAIADAQVHSIPATNLVDDPTTATRQGIFDRTEDKAQNWRRNFTVPELDDIREDTNAKLDDFYNKAGGDRHAALSNPETARLYATNNATRGLEYGQLSQDTGVPTADIEGNQRAYGNLTKVGNMVGNRDAVFSRQSPVSLAESMAVSGGNVRHGIQGFLAERALKNLTDSNALVRSAIDRYQNPFGNPLPPRSNLFSIGTSKLGGAIQATAPYTSGQIPSSLARLLFMPKQKQYDTGGFF